MVSCRNVKTVVEKKHCRLHNIYQISEILSKLLIYKALKWLSTFNIRMQSEEIFSTYFLSFCLIHQIILKDDHIDTLIEGESSHLQFPAKSKKINILQANGFQPNIHILLKTRMLKN